MVTMEGARPDAEDTALPRVLRGRACHMRLSHDLVVGKGRLQMPGLTSPSFFPSQALARTRSLNPPYSYRQPQSLGRVGRCLVEVVMVAVVVQRADDAYGM